VCTAQSREVRLCTAQSRDVRVCIAQYRVCHSRLCSTHTHYGQIWYHITGYIRINGRDRIITVILAKYSIELPNDGSLVMRNILEQF